MKHGGEDKMDRFVYEIIRQIICCPPVENNLPVVWKFQQNNDRKHTSKRIKNWFLDQMVKVLPLPS